MSTKEAINVYHKDMFNRRGFLKGFGAATLSATALTMMSGCYTARANHHGGYASDSTAQNDIAILNTAISAEQEAVAAYQLGAESQLLSPELLKVAVQFQGHHKEHIELLASVATQLGGTPNTPEEQYQFPVEQLKRPSDVLMFAAQLERGAVSAYAGAIPLFDNRDYSKAAASILADEAMHWAILRNALGLDPVPGAFFS
ncbi:ferritin-like domain-containing protein [Vibrio nigripulchritudo]|uniref:ferritin-like domain-containing protein n=1 Tax=Vibrio nigripulchritudo TaxID=28173 RepID=UPI0003B21231|nr:ferritin-like domain-containing protein [Vibrio nigripulchritudo]CCN68332.1 putative Ferritin/ribonucleotide reductase-like [Vibrio nigripulchritudo SFn118]